MEGKPGLANALHEAIIPEEIFIKAHHIRESRQLDHYIHKTLPSEAILSSVLKCGHCGAGMTPHYTTRRGKKYYYYRCLNSMKRDPEKCSIKQINRTDIEAIGVSLLRMLSKNKLLLKNVLERASIANDEAIEFRERQLRSFKSRIKEELKKADHLSKVMEEYDKSKLEVVVQRIEMRQGKARELDEKILATEKAIEALRQPVNYTDNIYDQYRYFWDLWRKVDRAHRKKAIQSMVKEIVLTPEDHNHLRLEIHFPTP